MSFSAHRPGRFGSDGDIELDVPTEALEDLYLSDLRDEDGRVPEVIPPRPAPPAAAQPTVASADEQVTEVIAPAADEHPTEIFDFGPREPQQSETIAPPIADITADVEVPDTAPDVVAAPVAVVEPRRRSRRERADEGFRPYREPKQRRPMRRLAILGGADGPILDRVPTETSRFVQMFFVLAGTALISGISMLFALTTGVQLVAWVAAPLAIVWALIIFNLDRFLTSSMKATTNIWRLLGIAIPRVIMAALIGIVVAEPLVLQIFNNDIAREVNSTNIVQAQTDQDGLDTGPEKLALDAARERVANLENQAATGIVAGTSNDSASQIAAQSTVDQLNTQMQAQQQVIDQARAMYQCELTGEGADSVTGCTGLPGVGASSDSAKAQLEQAQATYDALAAQLRTANADLDAAATSGKAATSANEQTNRDQAKDELPAARTQYTAALAAYNARADAVASGNSGAVGLLSQISALNRLGEKEPTLGWAHILIALLFFMIELLPIIVKVLTSWGEPSLYEKAETVAKQVESDRVQARGFAERAQIVQTSAA